MCFRKSPWCAVTVFPSRCSPRVPILLRGVDGFPSSPYRTAEQIATPLTSFLVRSWLPFASLSAALYYHRQEATQQGELGAYTVWGGEEGRDFQEWLPGPDWAAPQGSCSLPCCTSYLWPRDLESALKQELLLLLTLQQLTASGYRKLVTECWNAAAESFQVPGCLGRKQTGAESRPPSHFQISQECNSLVEFIPRTESYLQRSYFTFVSLAWM